MVDYSKVPDWLVSIIAEKRAKGAQLSRTEDSLLSEREVPALPSYLQRLKADDPTKFAEVLGKAELCQIEPYRERYDLRNLFLLAKKRKLIPDFGSQPEDAAYQAARTKHVTAQWVYNGITAVGLVLLNIGYTVPKWKTHGLLLPLIGNLSLLSSTYMLSKPVLDSYAEKSLVALTDAALVRKETLLYLQANQKLIYKYEPSTAVYPPNPYVGLEVKTKNEERRLVKAKEHVG
jgi:hypothetical protein